jgi:hypothetical protein
MWNPTIGRSGNSAIHFPALNICCLNLSGIRHADAIRALVEKLLNEGDAAMDKRMAEYRLKQVGSALVVLDPRRSAKLILEIMEFPGSHSVIGASTSDA